MGTTKKFEVWTDHENLKYFREPHKLNGWQARWYLKLQDYDLILRHILGKTNTKADVLSRKDQVNTKEDNKNVQILKEKLWTRQQTIADVTILWRNQVVEKITLLEEIQQNSTKEHELVKELENEDGQSWEEDGIVYVDRRIYMPNNQKIREKIL